MIRQLDQYYSLIASLLMSVIVFGIGLMITLLLHISSTWENYAEKQEEMYAAFTAHLIVDNGKDKDFEYHVNDFERHAVTIIRRVANLESAVFPPVPPKREKLRVENPIHNDTKRLKVKDEQ